MVAFYGLEKSLIDVLGSEPVMRQYFLNLKRPIKEEWENLRIFLQWCDMFGKEIHELDSIAETGSVRRIQEYLEKMAKSAADLMGRSEKLERRNKAVAKSFTEEALKLSGSLLEKLKHAKQPDLRLHRKSDQRLTSRS